MLVDFKTSHGHEVDYNIILIAKLTTSYYLLISAASFEWYQVRILRHMYYPPNFSGDPFVQCTLPKDADRSHACIDL